MITRSHRFHGYGSLRYVYQHGRTLRGPLMSVRYTVNDKRPSYRLAVVVSKKVHKSAVIRNRIRRRLYELARQTELPGHHDIVLTVFSDKVAEMPAGELQAQLSDLLRGIIEPMSKSEKKEPHAR